MKLRAMIVPAVLIIAVVTGGLGVSCKQQPPPPPPPPPHGGGPPPPPPPPPGRADLLLGEVRFEKSNDPGFNYKIIATIKNVGSGDATSFSAGCTYQCPPGEQIISAGLDIVQGGAMRANSEFTYRMPVRYQCIARPPTVNLACVIKPNDGPSKQQVVSVALP